MEMGHLLSCHENSSSGFTQLEVIAVMFIIGILSAVVISKAVSSTSAEALAELHQVKAHLRYAQSRAMADNADWGISFTSTGTYCLFQTDAANRRVLPGEDANTLTLAHLGITSAPQTVTFDGHGSPGAADVTIGTSGDAITVTANTGYIP
jgi:prepilin-type N-terminal cleavage/methylation domain-containing protein